jgi:hypothetical protein
MATIEDLDRHYNLFANASGPWDFFSGLSNYFSYVLKTPEFRRIVGREMQERNEMLRKRDRYEDRATRELNEAKEKLLFVIEINKIDVRGFDQATSWIPNPAGKDETILTRLKLFEEGKISISGYYSDNLENYIFDIAANLLRLGYEKEIKEFIVSNEEYARYYAQINSNDGSDLVLTGNIRGAFIFSKTWPLRFQQDRAIERARKLESWGAFEALIELYKGRGAALNDKNLSEIVNDALNDKDYVFDVRDAVNIAYAAQDFKILMKGNTIDEREMGFLKVSKIRPLSASAHSYLLQNFISEPDRRRSAAMTEAIKIKREQIERSILKKTVERMEQFMDRYEPTLERTDAFMSEHESEQYKKEEAEKEEKLEHIKKEVEEIKREKNKNDVTTKIEITNWPAERIKKADEGTPKRGLKSIHLIGDSAEPYKLISLVLDGNFKHPIRFAVKNNQKKETSIKRLYDIAYAHNVPGKKVYYNENLASSINNDLFTKKKEIADYMKSNELSKPQLVMKSPDDDTLILKGVVLVETMRPAQVQTQYRPLYEAKT